jgi:phosphatidylglycerol:prolipoprotein diacylglycerol transferase
MNFLYVADLASPSVAIAYGIGRIGCHLAGDGDYGIPTKLPWGTNYEHGIVPPSAMFRGSHIAAGFPDGIVPDNTPLHPTPIYEFLIALVIFAVLFFFAKKYVGSGKRFMLYLILAGLSRFAVEFLRLNPVLLFGITEAQFISLLLVITGILGFVFIKPKLNAAT